MSEWRPDPDRDRLRSLNEPMTARATLRVGDRLVMETETRATPLGLLAVGGLVAMILLSMPPVIRAKREGKALPPPRDPVAPPRPPVAASRTPATAPRGRARLPRLP